MNSWLFIPLFALTFFGLLVGVAQAKRQWNWSGEFSRKLIHALLGIATLSFPWLFDSPLQVWILAGFSIGILAWARWRAVAHQDRGALHDVNRQSLGDLCYPFAIALTFQLAQGNLLLYIIPVLVLALADAAGAVVGKRYGILAYRASDGQKSVEGSLSIGIVAFLSIHIPLLLLGDTTRAESVLIAAIIAILITAIESIAIRGLDNIYIPLVVFLLLVEMIGLSNSSLQLRLIFLLGLLLFGFILQSRSRMSGSAAFSVLLIFYLIAIGGGVLWVIPLLYTMAVYFWNTPRTKETASSHEIPGILAVAGSGLFWMVMSGITGIQFFWPFLVAFAIAAGHIHLAGQFLQSRNSKSVSANIQSIVVGTLPLIVTGATLLIRGLQQPLQGSSLEMIFLFLLATISVAGAILTLDFWQFQRIGPKNNGPRWLRQTGINFGFSSIIAAYTLLLFS